jgi:hypothetical protein
VDEQIGSRLAEIGASFTISSRIRIGDADPTISSYMKLSPDKLIGSHMTTRRTRVQMTRVHVGNTLEHTIPSDMRLLTQTTFPPHVPLTLWMRHRHGYETPFALL